MKRFFKYTLATVLLSIAWVGVVLYGTLNGWWHKPITTSRDTESFTSAVNENIQKEFVGNFVMAIMKDGKVENRANALKSLSCSINFYFNHNI